MTKRHFYQNKMKAMAAFLFAAIISLSFLACTENDNPLPFTEPVTIDKVAGHWYAELPQSGTIYQGEDQNDLTYVKAVHYYVFEADGTGRWTVFLLDADDKPVMQYGSLTGIDADGSFNFTLSADGAIDVVLLHKLDNLPKSWSLTYAKGQIYSEDGGADFVLSPATDAQTAKVVAWDDEFHGGSDGLRGSENLKFEKKDNANEAAVYTFEYPTKSASGEDMLMSATLMAWVPDQRQSDDKIESVHLYCHYTVTANRECPAFSGTNGATMEQTMLKIILRRDFGSIAGTLVPKIGRGIIIAADYEGYGMTKDRVHPYLAQEATARQEVDAVTYGLKLYRKLAAEEGSMALPLSDDFISFTYGYSQGGSTSLAVHRYIEQQGLDDELHFKGSVSGAGPHDLVATLRYYFDDDGDSYGMTTTHRKGFVSMPVVIPMIVQGMLASDPDMKGYKLEDYFSQHFLDTGVIDWLNSKEFTTSEIEEKWLKQIENGLTANGRTYTPEQMGELFYVETANSMMGTVKSVRGKADRLFTPEGYAYFANADNFKTVPAQASDAYTALHRALAKNDVAHGWQPRHRLLFLHSRGDMVAPYVNCLNFKEAHVSGEGTLFKVIDDQFTTSDHVDGGITFFMGLGLFQNLVPYFQWVLE